MPDWFETNAPTEGSRALPSPLRLSPQPTPPVNPLRAAMDWFQQNEPRPSSLYQTRITHTPGGEVADLGGSHAQWSSQSPLEAIERSDLSPYEKEILRQQWASLGPGFIDATPYGLTRPDVMRHEQLHALQYGAPALNTAEVQAHIANMVNPYITSGIENTPTYQEEIRQQGRIPVMAKEGSAFDLIPGMANVPRGSTPSPGLREYILNQLKNDPVRSKQFERLTDMSALGY